MQKEKNAFKEKFNRSLCVDASDDDEQCLGVLSHRNESISHVIGVDTINKAVIFKQR